MKSSSTASTISSATAPSHKQATSFLDLPAELQLQVLQFCSYKTLKQLMRTCKALKIILDDSAFDRALFRPSAKPASREELRQLEMAYKEHKLIPLPGLELHPLLSTSLCVWKISKIPARRELATNPPLCKVVLVMLHKPHHSHTIEHTVSGRPITVENIKHAHHQLNKATSFPTYNGLSGGVRHVCLRSDPRPVTAALAARETVVMLVWATCSFSMSRWKKYRIRQSF
ncbi:hypothetical protein A4X13_0g525 [Tilletia indica]|uniref:Uncharacterized protein n=1 Tax=Tilletia indica TaxID=43049 RepID=A0A177TJ93_9BASI|nr:hypothetical protein A4X13_0g525 [Tilletia indica]